MSTPPIFVDIFSGCGGLSLGLLKAGWQGAFAIERNADAFLTYQKNLISSERFRYDWPCWLPVQSHDIESVLISYRDEISKLRGKVDLIAGGPPCQGFSPAGKRNPKDPRNKMASHYISMVRLLKPSYLLMENVKGFNAPFYASGSSKESIPYSEVVKKRLEREGYKVSFKVIGSVEWGVPQLRPRFILIAKRKDRARFKWDPFDLFLKSRKDFLESRGLGLNFQTTSDAISDLTVVGKNLVPSADGTVKGFYQIDYREPEIVSPFIKLMREGLPTEHVPNSLRLPKHRPQIQARFANILSSCEKGRSLTLEQREFFGLKKHSITPLCPDRPAATMTTLPDDYLHYSEPRILTVREMARIQSFPDWFEFLGAYTTGGPQRKNCCPRYTQVGNAVPPLLGEALGLLMLDLFKSSKDLADLAA